MATLSSKVTPSGVATAAQGALADSAVQSNDSPTFNAVTATSYAGDGSALTGIAAGATGGGNDDIFYENGQNVTTNYTITNGKNAMETHRVVLQQTLLLILRDRAHRAGS